MLLALAGVLKRLEENDKKLLTDLPVRHQFEDQVDILFRRFGVVYHFLQTYYVLVFALLQDRYLSVDLGKWIATSPAEFPAGRCSSGGTSTQLTST